MLKQVKTGPEVGDGIAIEQGLNVGDIVIVDGLQGAPTRRAGAATRRRSDRRPSRNGAERCFPPFSSIARDWRWSSRS